MDIRKILPSDFQKIRSLLPEEDEVSFLGYRKTKKGFEKFLIVNGDKCFLIEEDGEIIQYILSAKDRGNNHIIATGGDIRKGSAKTSKKLERLAIRAIRKEDTRENVHIA